MTEIRYALYRDDPAFTLRQANPGDACYDLVCRAVLAYPDFQTETETFLLPAGSRCLVKTGVFLELEAGWEALVRPRSGNALNRGLGVLNSPGTIDAGYRNEVGVIVFNAGPEAQSISRGQKIAQLAIRPLPVIRLSAIPQAELNLATPRNLKGFGSSGS